MDESPIKYNEFMIDVHREKRGVLLHVSHGHMIGDESDYKFFLRGMKERTRTGDIIRIYARHTKKTSFSASNKRILVYTKRNPMGSYKPTEDYKKFEKIAEYRITRNPPQPRKRGSRPGKESKS